MRIALTCNDKNNTNPGRIRMISKRAIQFNKMFTLPLLTDTHPLKNYDGIGRRLLNAFFAILLFLVGIHLNWNSFLISVLVLATTMFFSRLTRKLMPDWAANDQEFLLCLSSSEITCTKSSETTITLEEIKSIEIIANQYQGFQNNMGGIVHNGVVQFTILFNDDKQPKTYKALVPNMAMLDELHLLVLDWQMEGLEIHEFYTHHKLNSFGLELNNR